MFKKLAITDIPRTFDAMEAVLRTLGDKSCWTRDYMKNYVNRPEAVGIKYYENQYVIVDGITNLRNPDIEVMSYKTFRETFGYGRFNEFIDGRNINFGAWLRLMKMGYAGRINDTKYGEDNLFIFNEESGKFMDFYTTGQIDENDMFNKFKKGFPSHKFSIVGKRQDAMNGVDWDPDDESDMTNEANFPSGDLIDDDQFDRLVDELGFEDEPETDPWLKAAKEAYK